MLKGSEISLLSLTERSQDIIPLAIRFISRYGPIHGVHEITDEALEKLVDLKKLRWLGLVRTGVTPEGADKLRKALPNCAVLV